MTITSTTYIAPHQGDDPVVVQFRDHHVRVRLITWYEGDGVMYDYDDSDMGQIAATISGLGCFYYGEVLATLTDGYVAHLRALLDEARCDLRMGELRERRLIDECNISTESLRSAVIEAVTPSGGDEWTAYCRCGHDRASHSEVADGGDVCLSASCSCEAFRPVKRAAARGEQL